MLKGEVDIKMCHQTYDGGVVALCFWWQFVI